MRKKRLSVTPIVPTSPLTLFVGGEQGAWYDPIDIATLFQDDAGTTPVTAAAQPVGRVLDKSGRSNHATQPTAARKPLYNTLPSRLSLDKVDDQLVITVPAGGWTGTMVLATDQGTASYGITIPTGAYNLGGTFFPGGAIVGALFRNEALTVEETTLTESYLVGNGATAAYGGVADFTSFWRIRTEITSFPLIDTSSGTNFSNAWRECSSLTSFPIINTSSGTIFTIAWFGCSSLTSFPLINTSSGTNFSNAWRSCSSLTSFPLINTSIGTDFSNAWLGCSSLTSFPLINTSSGTIFTLAWFGCSSLTSFPANCFDSVKGGSFSDAFSGTNLTQASIDGILASLVTSGIATGTRVFGQSGGSAPSAAGEESITTLRSRGWAVTVTGGF